MSAPSSHVTSIDATFTDGVFSVPTISMTWPPGSPKSALAEWHVY